MACFELGNGIEPGKSRHRLDVPTKKKPVPHCARSMATGRLSETATIE